MIAMVTYMPKYMITLIPHCRCKIVVRKRPEMGKVAYLYFPRYTDPILGLNEDEDAMRDARKHREDTRQVKTVRMSRRCTLRSFI